MQITPDQGAFLALMVKLMGAKRVIEVGVFTGYSSLAVAMVRRKTVNYIAEMCLPLACDSAWECVISMFT